MKNRINDQLTLPCSAIIKNRLGKSAMSENMATRDYKCNAELVELYRRWSAGGAGLLITGNVMIDASALGEPSNVVMEKNKQDPFLKKWAQAGSQHDTHIWVQLNHPGKQSPKFLSKKPVAPSAIELNAPLNRMFNRPKELSETEIFDLIERFGTAAKMSKEAGFTGVQIHGAHGYLISQFLSPIHNQRHDKWGGSLENRMRFPVEVYHRIRRYVGPQFPVSIKLNSADFQRGGFTEDESIEVARTLSELGMDLIEISGGSYEAPEMMGVSKKKSTREREAYFLDYCEKIRMTVKTPLMLTGGFRTLKGMEETLESGACDMIGLGRSLAINPEFPNQLLSGSNIQSEVVPLTTGSKMLDQLVPLEITWYTEQLHRMGKGLDPKPDLGAKTSIVHTLFSLGIKNLKRVRG